VSIAFSDTQVEAIIHIREFVPQYCLIPAAWIANQLTHADQDQDAGGVQT
jgi:hypothetical protein